MDYVRSRDGHVPTAHGRVLRDIVACRTKDLGGHVEQCDRCGHRQIAYNSCRNRHCPKCQAKARAKWMAARQRDLLPVEYFHVVFTLPREMAAIARQNPATIYDILFRAASETLLQIARDPRHLGADIGLLAVLHTWGQNLDHHPHVHCVVPGGGLSPDRSRWISCPPGFFLSVNVLSRVFRGKFIDLLKHARRRGKLAFQGELASLAADDDAFNGYLTKSCREQWVVYSKPPFGGPEQVLKYLARYTHRVAISNHRLLKLEDGKVTFKWKDYADGSRRKLMTLDAVEFIRRFLLHVLPKSFVRIRHCGILANRVRAENLVRCRELLRATPPAVAPIPGDDPKLCEVCGKGVMIVVELIEKPSLALMLAAPAVPFDDTS
jgi:Putative transposase/Transposase zinc-binding domain